MEEILQEILKEQTEIRKALKNINEYIEQKEKIKAENIATNIRPIIPVNENIISDTICKINMKINMRCKK